MADLYEEAGKRRNVDPLLLRAIATVESNERDNLLGPVTKSGERAAGRMQFMSGTARQYGVRDPHDPKQSIPGAAAFLDDLLNQYGNVPDALRHYNAGNPSRWDNPETRAYVGKVANAYQALKAQPMANPVHGMNDADLEKHLFGNLPTPVASPSAAPPAAAASMNDADLERHLFAPTDEPGLQRNFNPIEAKRNFATGAVRGGKDVVDTLALGLARGSDAVGLTAGQGDQVAAQNALGRTAYDAQSGDSGMASAGRAVGQVGVTLPIMGAGGALVRGAASLVPRAAPVVNFLTGQTGGNLLTRAASTGAAGALQGGAAGALTAEGSDRPFGEQVGSAAATGGALGAALPAAATAGRAIANSAVGRGIDAETARLATLARDKFGIPLRGGQISASPTVRMTDSVLERAPLTGYADEASKQQTAFNRAVAKTFGEDAPKVTPEVMDRARTRLGAEFDRIAGRSSVNLDTQLINDLGGIESDASRVLPGDTVNAIKAQITDVLDAATKAGGSIPGEAYQALTRKGTPLDRAMASADPNVAFYAGKVRSALDDALERSVGPELRDQLRAARLQYKNMKTIEDLVEKSPTGDISAPLLNGAVRRSFGDMAYSGASDLGDLAAIGQRFLKHPPDSGTAMRSTVLGIPKRAAELAAAAAMGGGAVINPHIAVPAAAGAAAGLGLGRAAGSVLRSDWYANMLLNGARAGAPAGLPGNNLQPYLAPVGAILRNGP